MHTGRSRQIGNGRVAEISIICGDDQISGKSQSAGAFPGIALHHSDQRFRKRPANRQGVDVEQAKKFLHFLLFKRFYKLDVQPP